MTSILNVPFHRQFHPDACGAAALEMVYRYIKPSKLLKFSQRNLFLANRGQDPHHKNLSRMTTDDVVQAAINRNLYSGWGRLSSNIDKMKEQVRTFVVEHQLPLIVCQKASEEFPDRGHFRVIIGLDGADGIIVHDPDLDTGASQVWSWDRFFTFSKATGANVTGGVCIWVSKSDLPNRPLDPDSPNRWHHLA